MKPSQRTATDEVIQHYYGRLGAVKTSDRFINEEDIELRHRIIEWEREYTRELVSQSKVSALAGILFLDQLSRVLARIRHRPMVGWELKGFFEQLSSRFRKRREQKRQLKDVERGSRKMLHFELRELTMENYLHVQERLKEYAKEPDAPVRAIKLIGIEFEQRIARLKNPRSFLVDAQGGPEDHFLEVKAQALEFEREAINDALHCNRISRATAKQMRDNVAMMELDIEEQLE
jgi:CPA1 family monovalent cation:H+ antiporter